jgi:hypothetical protein
MRTSRCDFDQATLSDSVVAGISDPGSAGFDYAFELADILSLAYNISDSISPWNGQSLDSLTNPARTGFSFT